MYKTAMLNVSSFPKISILVPTYNRSIYLKEALDSIFSQTFTNFEIIVTDNCSTDNTESIVRAYQDDRLVYLRSEYNVGAVGNYNRALRAAKGEFIYLFSDDDIMSDPNNLLFKVEILEKMPNIGLVHSTIVTIDKEGIVVGGTWVVEDKNWHPVVKQNILPSSKAYSVLYHGWNFITMSTVMLRREVLIKNRIEFNNQLHYLVDWAMWLQVSMFSDFYYIDKPLVSYRRHNNNETGFMNSVVVYNELLTLKVSLHSLFPSINGTPDIKKIIKSIDVQMDKKSQFNQFVYRLSYSARKFVKKLLI
jgi:glycosyltransferase involved in cell wall biosynthesis